MHVASMARARSLALWLERHAAVARPAYVDFSTEYNADGFGTHPQYNLEIIAAVMKPYLHPPGLGSTGRVVQIRDGQLTFSALPPRPPPIRFLFPALSLLKGKAMQFLKQVPKCLVHGEFGDVSDIWPLLCLCSPTP
jgi:hypothetical protein